MYICFLDKILLKILTDERTRTKSIDYLINALTKNPYDHADNIKPNSGILEIGNSFLGDIEQVFVIPLFENESKNYLEEFLTRIGRYK